MNLVLIGYRGTGKSAVASILAKHLAMPVFGMDDEIVRRAGRSIPAFVEACGWPAFRDLEAAIARDFSARNGGIIDCGGGVIERPENVAVLKKNGVVFWLRASVESIVARIADGDKRPSLTAGKTFTDEVADVLERRTPLYANASDLAVDTDDRVVETVAKEIAMRWRQLSTGC